MGERWDNFKQEMAWPVVKFQQWYENDDNRFVFWATTIAACVVTCVFYTGAALGLRAIDRSVFGNASVTVTENNPCLTQKGLIKAWAPAACYADKLERTTKYPAPTVTESERLGIVRNDDETVTVKNAEYAPPCKKDGIPGCTDLIYGKRLVSGTVYVTTLHNDEKIVEEGHLQPDYTEVEIDPCNGDSCDNVKEKFCGNVLDKFVPGEPIHVVLNESKQADYNGCYTVEVVRLTFGGDNVRMRKR